MSYDIYLQDKETKETLTLDSTHNIKGGTHVLGGTNECWLNITYNYGGIFYRTLGVKGIRKIYGMTGKESILIIEKAISKLKDNVHSDYWKPTQGNAKQALRGLLVFAKARPEGIWDGD